MPDPIPACFRGGAAAAPPASSAGPSVTTTIYETPLGVAALTWSRTVLGLSLRVELRRAAAPGDSSLLFRLSPWLLWKRRGSKKFPRGVDFWWDLSRARFAAAGGPEPVSGFFVAVVINGEMFLAAGDMEEEAFKKSKVAGKGRAGAQPEMVLRREHVVFSEAGRVYATRARFGGREREILIDLGGAAGDREARLCVAVDGKKMIQVKRLRWKFRGSEKVAMESGGKVQVSWDLHSWIFNTEAEQAAAAPVAGELGPASFIFRFEEAEGGSVGGFWERFWSMENFGGIDGGGVAALGTKKKRLLKTSSSSSSSSASSGSSLSVADWASPEETQLQGSGGFSLLICVWKS